MIALVTGASKGIGAACALALSKAGHRVALVARDEDALQSVAGSLPGESLVVPADLLDPGCPRRRPSPGSRGSGGRSRSWS